MTEAKKKGWFSKIESREDALKMIKDGLTSRFMLSVDSSCGDLTVELPQ